MNASVQQSIEKLRIQIQKHNDLYHRHDKAIISDYEYDLLFQQLLKLENTYPQYASPDSPSQKVGADVLDELHKVEHKRAMLSLSNVFTEDDLTQFTKRLTKELDSNPTYTIEPKLDGVAISLTYIQGTLQLALTRGDGNTGEDVTHTVKTIRTIPLQLASNNIPEHVEIRGEIFMYLSEFNEMNKQLQHNEKKTFANPRNASAGTIRQLDATNAANRPLRFFAYSLADIDEHKMPAEHSLAMQLIRSWQVPINPLLKLCTNQDELIQAYTELVDNRHSLNYQIDGAVIKLNSIADQQKMGFISRSPRWAVAWKFLAEQARTQLQAVDFQVGRSGTLTPVARLQPVQIGGVTVRNASLHNLDEIERLDVAIGDQVTIIRAGEVIPKIVSARKAKARTPIDIPKYCPICQSPVELLIKSGQRLRCSGDLVCSAQLKQKLSYFVSRSGMNIDGLGARHIETFIEKGLIKDVSDIYQLHNHQHAIATMDGFGKQSTTKLLAAIESSKKSTMVRFITALGITDVGKTTARYLAQNFNNLPEMIAAKQEQLEQLHDIGTITAQSIFDFFHNTNNREVIQRLLDSGIELTNQETVKTSGIYHGKTAVITGTLSRPRDSFIRLLNQHGIQVLSSLSKKTDWLICGTNPGSKKEKAQALNVEQLNEHTITEMLKQ